MGMFDEVVHGDRSVQVKCFGKSLAVYRLGDAVTLYRPVDGEAGDALARVVTAAMTAPRRLSGARVDLDLGGDLDPETQADFARLIDGDPQSVADFQVAVRDGTFLTVRAGRLAAWDTVRDPSVPCVDNYGRTWDGAVDSGAWPTTPRSS